ncbi:VanZ family protein [Porphyromonas circumdentaria]
MQVDVKISDKVVHFLMFFVLTLLLWGEYTFHYIYKRRENKIRWNGQLLYPLSIGILTELLQHYATSYRTGDFYDLLADIGGTLSAFLIGYIICHYIKKDIQK